MIKILDCTLRDGGYVNGWNFGEENKKQTARLLEESNIDLIEVGFIENKNEFFSKDASLYNTTDDIEKMLEESSVNENTNFIAMIMHEKFAPDCICGKKKFLKGIRYTFKKNCISEAFENCKYIIEKGFELYVQPVSINDYSDEEVIQLVKMFANLDIAAFYIVDTSGTMQKNQVMRLYYIIDNNLPKKVPIGFHSHNNLQLSFSNALSLIDVAAKREMYIDASVLGMGRGAGNLCTELMTQYINENIENKYNLIPVLEAMDEYIMPIYSKHPWGYSAPYYIAAVNGCHPNYASYLTNLQTLCVRDINSIIKSIPENKKHLFNKELIKRLYLDFQSHNVDDSAVIQELCALCAGRKTLVLAPGKSLLTYREKIEKYIESENPVIFAINHFPEFYKFDIIFVSNLKRFKSLGDAIERIHDKLICTSNISSEKKVRAVNYSDYLNDGGAIYDNSGLMLINVLKKAGVSELALAGYDGFSYADSENYFDESMVNSVNVQRQFEINVDMRGYFSKLRKKMRIDFITPSIYDNEAYDEKI